MFQNSALCFVRVSTCHILRVPRILHPLEVPLKMATFSAYQWYYIYAAGWGQQQAIGSIDQQTDALGVGTGSAFWWQLIPSYNWTPSNLLYLLRNHDSGPNMYLGTCCADQSADCNSANPITTLDHFEVQTDQIRTQWLIKASDPTTAPGQLGAYQLSNEGNGTEWKLTNNGPLSPVIQLTNTSTARGTYWTFVQAADITNNTFLDLPVSPSLYHDITVVIRTPHQSLFLSLTYNVQQRRSAPILPPPLIFTAHRAQVLRKP